MFIEFVCKLFNIDKWKHSRTAIYSTSS